MKYKVVLTREAVHDLKSIYRYIAVELQSVQNADSLLDRLEESILKLDHLPERFPAYGGEPWRGRNLRMMPVESYP